MKLRPARQRRIDNMDRETLLRVWRGEMQAKPRRCGPGWFEGETGDYWIKRLSEMGPLALEELLPEPPVPGLGDVIPPAVAEFFSRKLLRQA